MSIFNLKLREEIDLCNDKNYYFRFTDLPPAIQEGLVVDIFLQGGIGPFTWTMISAGSVFTDATTTGKQNELTCTTLPTSGHLQFSVEDSCGAEITGELVPLDYDPGEGCTSVNGLPIEITGEEEPSVGDVYTVTGGISPYIYTVDGGTISSTGVILTLTNCGGSENNGAIGRVTVIDAHGNSDYIVIRLPGGSWNFQEQVSATVTGDCNSSGHYYCYSGEYRYYVGTRWCTCESTASGVSAPVCATSLGDRCDEDPLPSRPLQLLTYVLTEKWEC